MTPSSKNTLFYNLKQYSLIYNGCGTTPGNLVTLIKNMPITFWLKASVCPKMFTSHFPKYFISCSICQNNILNLHIRVTTNESRNVGTGCVYHEVPANIDLILVSLSSAQPQPQPKGGLRKWLISMCSCCLTKKQTSTHPRQVIFGVQAYFNLTRRNMKKKIFTKPSTF